ncbi:hypothetical protein ACOME3_007658 [Neoechinorhynchus agilis]
MNLVKIILVLSFVRTAIADDMLNLCARIKLDVVIVVEDSTDRLYRWEVIEFIHRLERSITNAYNSRISLIRYDLDADIMVGAAENENKGYRNLLGVAQVTQFRRQWYPEGANVRDALRMAYEELNRYHQSESDAFRLLLLFTNGEKWKMFSDEHGTELRCYETYCKPKNCPSNTANSIVGFRPLLLEKGTPEAPTYNPTTTTTTTALPTTETMLTNPTTLITTTLGAAIIEKTTPFVLNATVFLNTLFYPVSKTIKMANATFRTVSTAFSMMSTMVPTRATTSTIASAYDTNITKSVKNVTTGGKTIYRKTRKTTAGIAATQTTTWTTEGATTAETIQATSISLAEVQLPKVDESRGFAKVSSIEINDSFKEELEHLSLLINHTILLKTQNQNKNWNHIEKLLNAEIYNLGNFSSWHKLNKRRFCVYLLQTWRNHSNQTKMAGGRIPDPEFFQLVNNEVDKWKNPSIFKSSTTKHSTTSEARLEINTTIIEDVVVSWRNLMLIASVICFALAGTLVGSRLFRFCYQMNIPERFKTI